MERGGRPHQHVVYGLADMIGSPENANEAQTIIQSKGVEWVRLMHSGRVTDASQWVWLHLKMERQLRKVPSGTRADERLRPTDCVTKENGYTGEEWHEPNRRFLRPSKQKPSWERV